MEALGGGNCGTRCYERSIVTIHMDPTLAAAMLGYPLEVESAPCYNCGADITLDTPVLFTRQSPLDSAAQWRLRAQAARHSPKCLSITRKARGDDV